MFSCENLSFSFGKKEIFNNVCFKVSKGSVVGLVGNNGEGKTTLLKTLVGVYTSDYTSKLTFSYYFDDGFFADLSGFENLIFYSKILGFNREKVLCLLKMFDMEEYSNIKYKKYSYGTKQKLGIILALCQDKDVYIFDEPLNGLDPHSSLVFLQCIKKLKKLNKIIVISSHRTNFLDTCCDSFWLLKNKILLKKDKIDLVNDFGGDNYEKLF